MLIDVGEQNRVDVGGSDCVIYQLLMVQLLSGPPPPSGYYLNNRLVIGPVNIYN